MAMHHRPSYRAQAGVSSTLRLFESIISLSGILDRPPEPVVGRRVAPTRWRTMTVSYAFPSSPQYLRDLFRRDSRSDTAVGNFSFDLLHLCPHRSICAQPRHHPLLQHRPHPFDLLLPPPAREFAAGIHRRPMVPNLRPP